jgi:hypothetical protein
MRHHHGVVVRHHRRALRRLRRGVQMAPAAPGTAERVAAGYLADVRLFAGPVPDLSRVRTQARDYVRGALAQAMEQPWLLGSAVEHYRRYADDVPAIAFCCVIEHLRELAEIRGCNPGWVWHVMRERREAAERRERGA